MGRRLFSWQMADGRWHLPKWKRLAASAAVIAALLVWIRVGPLPPRLLDLGVSESATVVDRHGEMLYESRADDGTRAMWLDEGAVPPNLISATVAAEDRRFHRHVGVDPIAVARAAWRNFREGAIVEGGSTISQQVAKLLIARQHDRERSRGLSAKIHEAIVALRLEHRLTKRQILTLYLNLAPYGNQIHGAERASRAYFGSPASVLTPAQAAFIAGLPQRPSRFNPLRNSAAASTRQRGVIDRMENLGLLSSTAATEAKAERLKFRRDEAAFVAPHFVEMVLAGFGDERPGRIVTTLDAGLQRDVQGIIRSHRAVLERHRARNVAVVVLKNDTAEWLAWEGSGDYFDAEHGGAVNGPLALRQPGSALKPFTYALAFEEGWSPASVLADVPSHFPTAEPGVVYSPRNYDGRYRGPLLARRALAGSENVPAVALASAIGVPKLVRFLRGAGLSTFDRTASHYGLGITLGNAEVRLAELVAAYAGFARGGLLLKPTAVPDSERTAERFISPRSAFWITDILSDANAREYIFGRGGSLDFPFPVAAKTGTSEGYHDNWAIGYTRDVTVGVWVGNFDRAPLSNSSGVTGAGPIFHAVMSAAERRVQQQALPIGELLPRPEGGVTKASICALSGMPATPSCPSRIREWLADEAAQLPCSWHHLTEDGVIVVWPPEYRQWAQANGLRSRGAPPTLSPIDAAQLELRPTDITRRTENRARLTIQNPPDGAIYLIDPTLRANFQTLALRASADRGAGRIEWLVNGQKIGTVDPDKSMQWPLTPGAHRIVAADTRGRMAVANIVVR
jgi:penicillin-binding protein 1C